MDKQIYCPNCGTKVEITSTREGYECQCQHCGSSYYVNRYNNSLSPKEPPKGSIPEPGQPPVNNGPYQPNPSGQPYPPGQPSESNPQYQPGQAQGNQPNQPQEGYQLNQGYQPNQQYQPGQQYQPNQPYQSSYQVGLPPDGKKSNKGLIIAAITIAVALVVIVIFALWMRGTPTGRNGGSSYTPPKQVEISEEKVTQTVGKISYEISETWKGQKLEAGYLYTLSDGSILRITYDDSGFGVKHSEPEAEARLAEYMDSLVSDLGLKETRRYTDPIGEYPAVQIDFSYVDDVAYFGILKTFFVENELYTIYYETEGVIGYDYRQALDKMIESIMVN